MGGFEQNRFGEKVRSFVSQRSLRVKNRPICLGIIPCFVCKCVCGGLDGMKVGGLDAMKAGSLGGMKLRGLETKEGGFDS